MMYNISQKQLNLISTIKKESLGEKRRLEEDDNEDTLDLGILDYGDFEKDDEGKIKKGFILPKDDDDDNTNDDNKEKSLADKMKDAKISIETEIKIEFKSWSEIYITTKTSVKKEWSTGDSFHYQYIFAFPSFPTFQLRLGFKFEIFIKFVIGLDIILGKEEDGFKFDIRGLIDFTAGIEIKATAEAGIYLGVVDGVVGISGSLFSDRVGVRIYISFMDSYLDFYVYLQVNEFKFHIFLELRANLGIYKGSYRPFDEDFSPFEGSLFDCSFYIRVNWFKESSDPVKKCASDVF